MQSNVAAPPPLNEIWKAGFWSLVAIGASLIWLAPRPPMIDLPQHAGQLTLWLDLLKGVSPWENILRINMLTPYLIGYSAALPFTALFGPLIAVKIVLTISYVVWIAACRALRKEIGSDPRLEFLFLYSFFGFAWQWGFMTFLVGAPLSILFLLCALRYAKEPRAPGGAGIVAFGVILLFSHALLFVFAVGIGGLVTLVQQKRFSKIVIAITPYAILALILVAFLFLARDFGNAVNPERMTPADLQFGMPVFDRIAASILFTTASTDSNLHKLLAIAAFAIPVLMGGHIGKGIPLVMLAILAFILLFVPDTIFGTGFVSNRFALFLPVFWALVWTPVKAPSRLANASAGLLALICVSILGVRATDILAFAKETTSFEKVLAAAQPGERAINLTFDRRSEAVNDDYAYLHMSLWYQAEKSGFVDFNFAYFFPQVVRFRKGIGPIFSHILGYHPDRFNWAEAHTQVFRYAFIRGSSEDVAGVAKMPACGAQVIAHENEWTLLRRNDCN